MRVVPRNQSPQIAFFGTHVPVWAEHAEEIGTTPELVAQLAAQVDAVRAARLAKMQAVAAAQAATLREKLAREAMLTTGATIVSQVRSKAATAGDGVYTIARTDVPKKASPIGAPGEPFGFRHSLMPDGAVRLSWKCKNPRGAVGTIYQVYRQIGMTGPFQYLGPTGEKRFEDTTIPTGASVLTYRVNGMRTTSVGLSADHIVNFGGTHRLGAVPVAAQPDAARKAA
jgi:hypothetical protein